MRWTRKSSTLLPTLITVFAWTLIVGLSSLPNVECFSSPFSLQLQPRSTQNKMFPDCQRSKNSRWVALPSVSTTRRRQVSRRSAALNPSSENGSLNQTTSSSSVQEVTSQTETTPNPLVSISNELPSSCLPVETKQPERFITRDTVAAMATVSVALLLALLGLLSASGPGGWRYYVAGGTCAAISHAIATPIDVVKVSIIFQP